MQAIGLLPAGGGLAGIGGSTSTTGSLQPVPTTMTSANPSANWSLGPASTSANLSSELSLMAASGSLDSLTGSGVVLASGTFQLTGSALAESGFATTGLFSEDETVSLPIARTVSETGSLLSLNTTLNNPNELSNGSQLLQTPVITLPDLSVPPTIPMNPPAGTGGVENPTSDSSSHQKALPLAEAVVPPNMAAPSSTAGVLAVKTPAHIIPPAAADAVLAANPDWHGWDEEAVFLSSPPLADWRDRDNA